MTAEPAVDYLPRSKSRKIANITESYLGIAPQSGLWLLVNIAGKPQYMAAYGIARRTPAVAATVNSRVLIASLSKAFLAAIYLLAQRGGSIDLKLPISTWFKPSFPAWHEITVEHLLQHTSGLKDYLALDSININKDYAEIRLLESIRGAGLDFPPGASWAYSNSGYLIAGIILGRALAQPYWRSILENICIPIGMNETGIRNRIDSSPIYACGYLDGGDLLIEAELPSDTFLQAADGGLWTSISDFAKWDLALRDHKIVAIDHYARMTTPTFQSMKAGTPYGMGFGIEHSCSKTIHWHDGAFAGFNCAYRRIIEDDVSICVLSNADTVNAENVLIEVSSALNSPC